MSRISMSLGDDDAVPRRTRVMRRAQTRRDPCPTDPSRSPSDRVVDRVCAGGYT